MKRKSYWKRASKEEEKEEAEEEQHLTADTSTD
jgi:hypothetical protein